MYPNYSLDIMLLCLVIIVLIIYLWNQNIHLEYFTDTIESSILNTPNNQLLPATDIHFMIDNTPSLIEAVIFNYKFTIDSKTDPTVSKNNTKKVAYLSVFRHKDFTDNYCALGQYMQVSDIPLVLEDVLNSKSNSNSNSIFSKKVIAILTSSIYKPLRYDLIWSSDINDEGKLFTVWRPVAPEGTIALGDIIIQGTDSPSINYTRCLPITMLESTKLSNGIIWETSNDMGRKCVCWGASNIDIFKACNNYTNNMPELNTVYNLPQQFLNQNNILAKSLDSSKGVKV